jgi:hypothetical protein
VPTWSTAKENPWESHAKKLTIKLGAKMSFNISLSIYVFFLK